MDRLLLDLPITDGVLQLTVLVAATLAVQLTLERIHLAVPPRQDRSTSRSAAIP